MRNVHADIYDHIRPDGVPPINPGQFEAWTKEDEYRALRRRQLAEHGAIGRRACQFTEGGYCTLYRERARLRGRGGVEDLIAAA